MATGGRNTGRGAKGAGRRGHKEPAASAERPSGSQPTRKKSTAMISSPLDGRYTFTPAARRIPTSPAVTNPTVSVRDYPPPERLVQRSLPTTPRTTPPERHTQPHTSPHSEARTHPSSQDQNSVHDDEVSYGDEYTAPRLAEDQMAILNRLLTKPGREEYTTVLSPTIKPNTTWFGRDKGSLTRKITKIFTRKFDGPYYSWSCVPRDRQERYFVEFAARHTWDPLITGLVQDEFEIICKRRMKDMVSTAKASGEKPTWISEDDWTYMCKYWATEEAKTKSSTTSRSRMSDRGGLGPHIHFSGQKSSQQVQQEMVTSISSQLSY